MAPPGYRAGSLGEMAATYSRLNDPDQDTKANIIDSVPDNLDSLVRQVAFDPPPSYFNDPKKREGLQDACITYIQYQGDTEIAAYHLLPDRVYDPQPWGNDDGFQTAVNKPTKACKATPKSPISEIQAIIKKLTEWSNDVPKDLAESPELLSNLTKAAECVAEKAWRDVSGLSDSKEAILTPPVSTRTSISAEGDEEGPLFFPEDSRRRPANLFTPIPDGFATPVKRSHSEPLMESPLVQARGRFFDQVTGGPSSSPIPPAGFPERPREPSRIPVAYLDIHKSGEGKVANITDIVLDTPDFAARGLLPMAISGSFIKGMELWGRIGLQPRDPAFDSDETEIRRRDDPWQKRTMIARITYDPTQIDLSQDHYFDFHFSSKGARSEFSIRHSSGTWDGYFPPNYILMENFEVTHYVKAWDPTMHVDDITRPTRLPDSAVMQCRKAKCHEQNELPVEREYLAPLDPQYVTRFGSDKNGGNGTGGGGHPHFGGDGEDGDDDDGETDNDDKRKKIKELTAMCTAHGKARLAELDQLEIRRAERETKKNKGKGKATDRNGGDDGDDVDEGNDGGGSPNASKRRRVGTGGVCGGKAAQGPAP